MNDMTGVEISVGDTVAFATLSYKKAHLRYGKVQEFGHNLYGTAVVRIRYGDEGSIKGISKSPEKLVVVRV